MNTIAFATSDWNGSAYVKPICDEYSAFAKACGFDPANHAIATAYDDREANIGFHYDKTPTLSKTGAISVVKVGRITRRFCLRKRIILKRKPSKKQKLELEMKQRSMPLIFDEYVEPGTLIFMTMNANWETQHGVPEEDGPTAASGSLVFRTAAPTGRRTVKQLTAKSEKLHRSRTGKIEKKSKKAKAGKKPAAQADSDNDYFSDDKTDSDDYSVHDTETEEESD